MTAVIVLVVVLVIVAARRRTPAQENPALTAGLRRAAELRERAERHAAEAAEAEALAEHYAEAITWAATPEYLEKMVYG